MALRCVHHPGLTMPVPPVVDFPVETVVPYEGQLPFDGSSLSMPLMLEGMVESFDPVLRAEDLAVSLPRQWCGTYLSFTGGPSEDVLLTLANVTAMGQMLDVRGDMQIGDISTSVQGNFNAKSDQLDLIPLSKDLTADLESGGDFVGLQGFSLSGWNAPRLTHRGGRLQLQPVPCVADVEVLEAVPIRGLW